MDNTLPALASRGNPYSDGDDRALDSDDDEYSSREDGDGGRCSLDHLESSIFQGYQTMQLRGKPEESSDSHTGLSKIRDLLIASRSGAICCLICLEKVRVSDPIWHCKTGCHAVYHLICIQAWAAQACSAAAERSSTRLSQNLFPTAVAQSAAWHCPKCRTEFTRSQIPRESKCFCGKVVDPPFDPWLTAHSCGQICERPLPAGCGHNCKLLCHPGACPPCPQFVEATCFCKARTDVRRCGHKHFSCGKACGKALSCGIHVCLEACHAGLCPPCKENGNHRCRCGLTEEVRACLQIDFQCGQPCEKWLQCKKHRCKKVCHSGSCGECELQGRQRCPCGKVEYKGMDCDAIAPTCGSTCEKWLPCSIHRCQERCHIGSCKNLCRIVTLKVCRCGSLTKEVPCYQDLLCDRKCQRLRDCKRHPCKRRCCSGECPPCSEVCGRKLRCGNHKCLALCHRGSCAPCPVSVRISCACGSTAYEVPCGAEREKRPPRCSKFCQILPRCRHGAECKAHRCHYGGCPPCELMCNSELPCGHKCKQRCHDPPPIPNPEFNLKQKKKLKAPKHNEMNLGLPCTPCSEPILKHCLGWHVGGEQMMVCSESFEFSCGMPCGNLLGCGNHSCQKPCHEITKPLQTSDKHQIDTSSSFNHVINSCEQCMLTCQKKRVPPCPHQCMQACHPGDCSPCKARIKRSCYCGTLVHVFECSSFRSLPEDQQKELLSCRGPCHRKLSNCTHLCTEICHPGPCLMAANCQKKVSVRCPCQHLKKEWVCSNVQAAYNNGKFSGPRSLLGVGLLACNDECAKLAQEVKQEEEIELLRQRKPLIVEDQLKNKVPRRRRRHELAIQEDKYLNIKEICRKVLKVILMLLLILLITMGLYFGIRELQKLSDWMNELDARRPRKGPRGSIIR